MDKSSTVTACLHFGLHHRHQTCAEQAKSHHGRIVRGNYTLGSGGNRLRCNGDEPKRGPRGVGIYRTALTNLQLKDVPFENKGNTILCDTFTGQPKPIVPSGWRRRIFGSLHRLSHPSIPATRRLTASKFVWHGVNKQVGILARACISCQTSKVHQHVKAPFQTFHVPCYRFDHIHIHLVGPLPPSQGFTDLLTIVDRSTGWSETIPLWDTSSIACAKALVKYWISRVGVLMHITSDMGT